MITAVAGTPVDSVAALKAVLGKHRSGDSVVVAWMTVSGQQERATVTLATPPPQ